MKGERKAWPKRETKKKKKKKGKIKTLYNTT